MHPGATHYKVVRIQGRHHSAQRRLPTQTASHCPRWRRLRRDRHYREIPSQRQVVLELGITWLSASVLEKEFYDTAWIPTTVQTPGDNLLDIITGSTFPENRLEMHMQQPATSRKDVPIPSFSNIALILLPPRLRSSPHFSSTNTRHGGSLRCPVLQLHDLLLAPAESRSRLRQRNQWHWYLHVESLRQVCTPPSRILHRALLSHRRPHCGRAQGVESGRGVSGGRQLD